MADSTATIRHRERALPGSACDPAARITKSLLGYGVLAGVVFEVSILSQGLAVVSIHLYAEQNRPGPAAASPAARHQPAARNRQPS